MFYNKYFEEQLAYYSRTKERVGQGENHALRAYNMTKKYLLETFTVEDTPFAQDMEDFINMIDEAGITEFNLCERSSGLMSILHFLLSKRWSVVDIFEQDIADYTTLYGLRMKKQ